ncbi:MAG: DsbA family protein [Thiolinea sp.]
MNKQKREHQQQVKAQKQAAAARNKKLLRFAMFGAAALLAVFLVFSFAQNMALTVPANSEVISTDQSKGFQKSPVILIEYSDFQCPACRAQHNTIRAAWPDIRRKVHFVYRHYPLVNIHPHANLAAHYAEAAGQQEKFWEMHDQLFDNQTAWAELDDPTEKFDEYARAINLDLDKLKADLESDVVKDKVRGDIASARDAGVRSTPTLFLNGEMLSNVRGKDQLVEAVDTAWDMR